MHRLNYLLLLVIGFLVTLAVLIYPRSETSTHVLALGCTPNNLSGIPTDENIGYFEGSPTNALKLAQLEFESPQVLSDSTSERWIEIDLSDQKLIAWEGDLVYLQTPVSTGLARTPTPVGEFRIWIKLRSTKMEGGEGRYYYYLPNVPYVMFFENKDIPGRLGYGIHGTYWHDDFGTPRSHGCVNVPTETAGMLYNWVRPDFTRSKYSAKATKTNPGTRVVIHE